MPFVGQGIFMFLHRVSPGQRANRNHSLSNACPNSAMKHIAVITRGIELAILVDMN